MLKILQILIMLNGIAINAYNIKIMNNRENFQSFNIECLDLQDKVFKAVINVWTEKKTNPTITNISTKKSLTYQGIYDVVCMEYKDSRQKKIKIEDIRTFEAFYTLYSVTEIENIRMLIKGCSLEYYMVKFLTNTLLTMKLNLGQRVDYSTPTISIFEPENDVKNIVTIEKQKNYYNTWLESIKGLPY